MGHTSGALRSRNSASSAPGPASGRKSASMVERWVGEKQPNVPGCLGWFIFECEEKRPKLLDGTCPSGDAPNVGQ
jgi:hypothetical protein